MRANLRVSCVCGQLVLGILCVSKCVWDVVCNCVVLNYDSTFWLGGGLIPDMVWFQQCYGVCAPQPRFYLLASLLLMSIFIIMTV